MKRNELMHYGVRGQKWGRRQYQNTDGSLTSAGKAHYGVGDGGRSGRGSVGSSGGSTGKTKWSTGKKIAVGLGAAAGAAALAYGGHRLAKGMKAAKSAADSARNLSRGHVNWTNSQIARQGLINTKSAILGDARNVAKTATNAYNATRGAVGSAANSVAKTATNAYNTAKGAVGSAANSVAKTASGVYGKAKGAVNSAAGKVAKAAKTAGNAVKSKAQQIGSDYYVYKNTKGNDYSKWYQAHIKKAAEKAAAGVYKHRKTVGAVTGGTVAAIGGGVATRKAIRNSRAKASSNKAGRASSSKNKSSTTK